MYATLQTVGGRNVLRFERRLTHPIEKVWTAITQPDHLEHWFPARMEMELRRGAPIRFVFANNEGPTLGGEITELDPPRLFEYTWDEAVLRWELRPEGKGCVLMFTHTFGDRPAAASFATGWDTCLEALMALLAGEPAPSVPYVERHEEYVEWFGLLEGHVEETVDGWLLRFERQFPYPIETVWANLAGSDEPAVGSPPPLGFTNAYVPAKTVTTVDPPDSLAYASEAGSVRWQLSGALGGMTRVALAQTGPRELADQRPTALAAWHTHLELLARQLRGEDACPWPEERTEELRGRYSRSALRAL